MSIFGDNITSKPALVKFHEECRLWIERTFPKTYKQCGGNLSYVSSIYNSSLHFCDTRDLYAQFDMYLPVVEFQRVCSTGKDKIKATILYSEDPNIYFGETAKTFLNLTLSLPTL